MGEKEGPPGASLWWGPSHAGRSGTGEDLWPSVSGARLPGLIQNGAWQSAPHIAKCSVAGRAELVNACAALRMAQGTQQRLCKCEPPHYYPAVFVSVTHACESQTTRQNVFLRVVPSERCTVPWLVWLGGLGIVPQMERSQVLFQVGAHTWVAGQVPSWGPTRDS